MIKAYHRVSSESSMGTILDTGALLPAAWRIDPDQAIEMCQLQLADIGYQKSEARRGVERLLDERIEQIASLQEHEGVDPVRSSNTMMFCVDLLAGDFANVFLAPGGFTNATIARGWPLSGFAFDADELIRRGAEYRPEDFMAPFRSVVARTLRSDLGELEAYEAVKLGLEEAHRKALQDSEALAALQVFDNPSHDPTGYKEYSWPSNAEVVWPGPLPIDLAVEIWANGKLVEARVV